MKLYTRAAARLLVTRQQLKRMIEYALRRRYVGYIRAVSYELVVKEDKVVVKMNVPIHRLGTYHDRYLSTTGVVKVKLGTKIKKNPYKIRKS